MRSTAMGAGWQLRHPGVQAQAQRAHDLHHRDQFRMAVLGKRLAQASPRNAGFAGNLPHAASARDHVERVSPQGRIAIFERRIEVGGDVLRSPWVLKGPGPFTSSIECRKAAV